MSETSYYRVIVFCILFSALFFFSDIKAQTYSNNTTPYKIKIIDSQKGSNKGILYSVTDSTLIIISELDFYRFKNNVDFQKTTISFNQIDKIKISKKNHFWRSFGITTIAGAAIGAISGYSSGDDKQGYVGFKAKEKAVISGVGGTIIGALTGTVIGLIKINIPIDKQYVSFSRKKDYLLKRSLSH